MAQATQLPGPTLETWKTGQGIEFVDDEAKRAYQERAGLFADAIRLDRPERVPVNVLSTFYPAFHADITPETAMNDAEALSEALQYFATDLDLDAFPWATPLIPSAKSIEMVDYQVFDWPGDGSSPDTVYQCKEAEYMGVEDYDALIRDPTDYLMREYVPTVFGGLEGMRQLPQFPTLSAGIASLHPFLLSFGLPPVREALETLLEAGEEALRWQQIVGGTVEEIIASGYPQSFGGITLAPYDILGDTVRGTRGIMMDLKRRPETLLEALDGLTSWAIEMGISSARISNNPLVFIPLHKGADGFMSGEEFETFYWPQLRRVIDALVAEDMVPWIFAEGSYEDRLDVLAGDLPDGNQVWHFQNTDMGRAKAALGDQACVAGNVPTSLLYTATPADVTDYCTDLIDEVGEAGFILAPGVGLDEARPENIRAMVQSVR